MGPGSRIALSKIASGQFDLSKLQPPAGDRKTTLKVERDAAGVPVALVQTSRPRLFNWLLGTSKQEREVKQVVMQALAAGDHSKAAVSQGTNRAIDRMNLKPDRIRSFAELREVLREVRIQTRAENAPKVPVLSDHLMSSFPGADGDLGDFSDQERSELEQRRALTLRALQLEGLQNLNLELTERGLPNLERLIQKDPVAFAPLARLMAGGDAADPATAGPISAGEIETMQRALSRHLALSIDVASLLKNPADLGLLDQALKREGLPPALTLIAESSLPPLKRTYSDEISLHNPDFPRLRYPRTELSRNDTLALLQQLVNSRLAGEDPTLATRPPRADLAALVKTALTAPVAQREEVLTNALHAIGYPRIADMAPDLQQALRTALQGGPDSMTAVVIAQGLLDELGDTLSQPGTKDLPRISLREVLAPKADLASRVAAGLAKFDRELAAKGYPPLDKLRQDAQDDAIVFADKRQEFIDLSDRYREHGCLSPSDGSRLGQLIGTLTHRKARAADTTSSIDVFRLNRGQEGLERMLDRRLSAANYPPLGELRTNPELGPILDAFVSDAGNPPSAQNKATLQRLLDDPEIRNRRRPDNEGLSADDLLNPVDSSNTWTDKSNHRVMTALLSQELKRTGHPDLDAMRAANPNLGRLLDKYQRVGMLDFDDLRQMQAIFNLYSAENAADDNNLPAVDGLLAPPGRRDVILSHLAHENLLQDDDHQLDEGALLSRLDAGSRRQAEIDAQLAGLDAHLRDKGYPCLDALVQRSPTIGELIGRYRATGELDSTGFNRLQLAIDGLQRKSLSYSDLSGNRSLKLADLQPGDILIDISGFETDDLAGFHNQTLVAQTIFSHPGGESTAKATHAYVYGGTDGNGHLVHEVTGRVATREFSRIVERGRIQVIRPRFKATASALNRAAGEMTRTEVGAEFRKFYNGKGATASIFRRIITRKSREPGALEGPPSSGNTTTTRDRMYFCSQHVAHAVQEGMFATGLGRHAALAYDPKLIDPKYLQGKLGASRHFATIGEIDMGQVQAT